MSDNQTSSHTVTIDKQFAEQLCEQYPAATSVPQAIVMAAQDGVAFKQSFDSDLETYVSELARDAAREEVAAADLDADAAQDTRTATDD